MTSHSEEQGEVDYKTVDKLVIRMLEPPTMGWYFLFGTTVALTCLMFFCFGRQMMMGLGANSGINKPIAWGFFITNFVFLGWYRPFRNINLGGSVSL